MNDRKYRLHQSPVRVGPIRAGMWAALLFTFVFLCFAVSCNSAGVSKDPAEVAPTPGEQANAEPEPLILKIGYSKFPYPPLQYLDDNKELIGFDIELAKAAAQLMNAELEFIPIDWSDRASILTDGEVDMLWGGLERASLDEQQIKFTKSYLRSDIVLLMNEEDNYSRFEDLQGLSVCALNFTPAFYYLQVYNRDVIKSRRSFTPPQYRELLNSLSSGEFDCMITDTSFAAFYRQATGIGYKMSDTVLGSNYAVALRIEDVDLFESLQAALDALEADGTIARLREKWIPAMP